MGGERLLSNLGQGWGVLSQVGFSRIAALPSELSQPGSCELPQ